MLKIIKHHSLQIEKNNIAGFIMNPSVTKNESRSILLRRIIRGEFHPFFQPIVSLENQRVMGFELLARHISPNGNVTSPGEFIPAMERHGLLNELMSSLMEKGFKTAVTWDENIFLSINVSPSQFEGNYLSKIIEKFSGQFGMNLSRVKIEITETALIDDIKNARTEISALSEIGCTIAMDDFGTGYSSLGWLILFPVDTLKIDCSFIRSMLSNKDSRKIISSVVGLGRSLNMEVIAEGVETEEEADMLRGIGCPYVQGYFFGKPMPAEDTRKFLSVGPCNMLHRRIMRLSLEQRAHQISSMYAVPGTSICFLDPDLLIVDASDTFAERVGWLPQDLIGRHIYNVVPSQAERLVWLQEFRKKGLPYPPYEVALPGGALDLVMITRVEDEAKELLGFCVFCVNINARGGILKS